MKRLIFLVLFVIPVVLHAQSKLTQQQIEDFSARVSHHFQLPTDPITEFIAEQLTRTGSGGLDVDKTMMELQKDPAALDASLKFLFQFSDCNRQKLIANLRSMDIQSGNVYPITTYTVNKYKGDTKALLEEKPSIVITTKRKPPMVLPSAGATTSSATATVTTTNADGRATTATTAATAAGSIAAQPVVATAETLDWDVRKLFQLRDPAQLSAIYGAEHVVARQATDKEGNELGQAYYVYPDTDDEMQVIFDGDNGTQLTFKNEHSKWKSPYGIKVGDPLEKIIKINTRGFRMNAFEWTKGGEVTSWEKGAIDGKGVHVIFRALNSGDPKLYDQVTGDKKISSDHPALKKLGVVVEEVSFKSN
ncbi:hypothetical protein KTO58_20285 [Chitinophaga pendula]|uniref:hypothetical protein n=1 Tax=Chitinophaga TaxID=79328 RepID=UPI000BAF2140|nr:MULTISPECIES: hypothetical protein [Chitinophaga]ASZ11006.1 hypothetical protein CK934_08535 [Chitinophaga sp. MD30]UCJ06004.1 hypothetical protein KTO58_20285 [Chitinophaga pendula]